MRASRPPLIALLTDFGTAGWYVASMKAVIFRVAPHAQVVDITHEIPPYDVVEGAFTLAEATRWFPRGTVFACVVDPGVGTSRALIAAAVDGQMLVGPDNGLFSLVLRRGRHASVVRLTNRRYWWPSVSPTFHGRDIIAPVAAHLACGRRLAQLGSPCDHCLEQAVPVPTYTATAASGVVLFIDRFGNAITNLPGAWLTNAAGGRPVRFRRRRIRVVSSYQEGAAGELVALIGSSGYLELAVNQGSAAAHYRLRRGNRVELRGAS